MDRFLLADRDTVHVFDALVGDNAKTGHEFLSPDWAK
jgi:hypothetical protein